jgi:hypothetical protein
VSNESPKIDSERNLLNMNLQLILTNGNTILVLRLVHSRVMLMHHALNNFCIINHYTIRSSDGYFKFHQLKKQVSNRGRPFQINSFKLISIVRAFRDLLVVVSC